MLHWFDPGKYAAFVAAAYGVSGVVLGAMVLESLWRARQWRKAAERNRPAGSKAKPKGATRIDSGSGAP